MLRIDKIGKKLVRLKKSPLSEADHWERHLQGMICSSPDPFCEDIGESLWIIGQEVRPSEAVADRIDILAVDESGAAVVIELKRGTHKLQLLQAISYAGMVSRWHADQFVTTLAANYSQSIEDARSAIEDHTGSDISLINSSQRLLLIAEDFDPAVLVAAEWLHEHHNVDVRCYRLQLSQEDGSDYLTCTCAYPPIEIATLTRRGDRSDQARAPAWADWDGALKGIENVAVKDFFKSELGHNQENRLRYRELIYRLDDKRRFWVTCRQEYAYVWQRGRFAGDDELWRRLISKPQSVGPRHEGRSLRFNLVTPDDFASFKKAVATEVKGKSFSEDADLEPAGSD